MDNEEMVGLTFRREDCCYLLAGMRALQSMMESGIIDLPDELLNEEDFEPDNAIERIQQTLFASVKPKPKIGF
jgi:hypothetical protein